ncbi:GNAT family N-acetyltransferase [Enemella dayhoffiae]|uniref:GNAT family N-acetyltransferase n=1 Tax=Enemella dayhoffiae TaxID=2016507 RepID=A0A255GQL4_9ACTN|nr:GNAT family N-acetyltransferase [Enemella dayhoffiae]OYO18117.1 GNAT family N-acetyltransferase [Enemella dayhoffiae]
MRHRPLTSADEDLLRHAVYAAVNWSVGRFTSTEQIGMEQVASDPALSHYWRDPRPAEATGDDPRADLGLVAVTEDDRPVAVAWLRFFTGEDPGYGFVGPSIPELTVAVPDPDDRAEGTGRELLCALLELARERGLPGVSLSVDPDNPARDLYERLGFRTVGFSGTSETMLLAL